jgi:hypothetical protein
VILERSPVFLKLTRWQRGVQQGENSVSGKLGVENSVSLRQESSGKEKEPRNRKPFTVTLRVNESRPARLDQAAGSESCVGGGDSHCEA